MRSTIGYFEDVLGEIYLLKAPKNSQTTDSVNGCTFLINTGDDRPSDRVQTGRKPTHGAHLGCGSRDIL